jgi:isoleucyl-tRNA synthetase
MTVKEVKGQYKPQELETNWRNFWESEKIPQKIVNFDKKKKKFYLLDGPPYVNQVPHVGNAKTTTMKDIWSKFKQMQGFSSWWQPGFDTHGLAIENMVERNLGLKSKKDILKMGIEKFMEEARKLAQGNEKYWLELYKRMGAWRGYYEPYITFKNYYIESGWWTVKTLWEKGMLVRGEKPIHWCPHCETAVSGYEVTDSYADVKDPSIFVKFPIVGKPNEYFVIWTTTPWTLVSNTAIAVHPDEYYVKVKVGNDVLIVAEKRVEPVFKDLLKVDYEIKEKILGKKLEGMKYKPALDVPVQRKLEKEMNAHKIILSLPVMKGKAYKHSKGEKRKGEFKEFVTMEEGSGLVHTAPGHGAEDHFMGLHYNLPVVSPLDDEGKYTEDGGEFKGIFVKDADKIIVEKLEKKNLLLNFSWAQHTYPLCWRCKTPLIFRVSKQWFFKIDTIKEKMINENKKVKWMPEFAKERFHNWLENAIDWNISQQRYWGIPLPVWVCEKCEAEEVIGSEKELRERSKTKLPKEIDLHRHVVDKIEIECEKCQGNAKRVEDTMNPWFDSGISTWASFGYPYKNKDLFETLFPVDMICEAQDQIRGWFYSLMFCGVSAFNKSPYKAVSMLGWVVDEKGEPMHKSKGNFVSASDALNKLGADVLRLYYCWEIAPWELHSFSFKSAEEVRKAVNILWNSYSFFTTYAVDFKPKLLNLEIEDKWLLSRVNSLVSDVTRHLENFEMHLAARKTVDFILNDLSRFYIKLVRDRVWVSEKGKTKNAALSTLYFSITTLAKLLAPITPFISEEIYQNVEKNLNKKSEKSIHLSSWPITNKKLIDEKLEEMMNVAKNVIDASLSARQQANIKLRWPMKRIVVVSTDKKTHEAVTKLRKILQFMANVKTVEIAKSETKGDFISVEFASGKVFIDKKLDEEMMKEALIRELIREVQDLRKKNGFNVKQTIKLTLVSGDSTAKLLKKNEELIKKEVGASQISFGKILGNFAGKVTFEGKEIDIGFDKS